MFAARSTPAAGPASRAPGRPVARLATVLAGAALLGLSAMPAARAADDGLSLSDAWIRMIVPARPAAGYFTLKNDGDETRALIGATSPACGDIMLHQSRTVDGVDKMMMVSEVKVPAHGSVSFAPRGYHLMCMRPVVGQMKPGNAVPVTLRFKDGASLTGQFTVHGATGK